jgi:hypothetical protein
MNLLLLNYTLGQGQKEHINPANNQVSHNTKIKSRERKQAIKTNNWPIKKIVAQHQVEQWEEKKG